MLCVYRLEAPTPVFMTNLVTTRRKGRVLVWSRVIETSRARNTLGERERKDLLAENKNPQIREEAVTKIKRLAMRDTIEERDKLLQETDWTEFPHVPMAEKRRESWRGYRQALRDFPSQEFDLDDTFRPRRVIFPEKPE